MISVVLATYNGELFLEEQLNSIINQTKQADEILILDDNSIDKTKEIIKKILKNGNSNIKLIENNCNLGHYKNFMKGLKIAKGNYIFFSDQDDIWELNKIEKMYKVLKENKTCACVRSESRIIDSRGKVIFEKKHNKMLKKIESKYVLNTWGSGYEMAIKKEFRDFILRLNPKHIEAFDYHDTLIGMLSTLWGDFFHLDEILNSHRIHENNVTRKISTKSFKGKKKDKMDLLKKHDLRFDALFKILNENKIELNALKGVDEYKKKLILIKKFIKFTKYRLKLMESKSIRYFIILIFYLSNYNGIKGYISDCIYALNLNAFIRKVFQKGAE